MNWIFSINLRDDWFCLYKCALYLVRELLIIVSLINPCKQPLWKSNLWLLLLQPILIGSTRIDSKANWYEVYGTDLLLNTNWRKCFICVFVRISILNYFCASTSCACSIRKIIGSEIYICNLVILRNITRAELCKSPISIQTCLTFAVSQTCAISG